MPARSSRAADAIIYILLGRFFIRGILAGSVKG